METIVIIGAGASGLACMNELEKQINIILLSWNNLIKQLEKYLLAVMEDVMFQI